MNLIHNYSKFIYNHSCKLFSSFLIINLLISGFLIGNNYLQFTNGGSYDWVITNSKISEQNDALRLAYGKTDSLTKEQKISERSRQSQTHSLSYIYKWKDDRNEDIFTPKNIKTICEVEKIIIKNKDYNNFCYLQKNKCEKISTSVTNLFYPFNHNWECDLLEENIVNTKKKLIYDSIEKDDSSFYGFFIGKKMVNSKNKITRTIINLGEPLKGFNSSVDRPAEQREKYLNFFSELEEDYIKMFNVKTTFFRSGYLDKLFKDDLEVKYYSWNLNSLEFNRVVNGDMTWTLCSILFVSVWIGVHTGSLFTTIFSMLQIILSMTFSFLFYRLVFGISYFTQLHGCAIFLALGIGADDIFVYSDAWIQNKNEEDLSKRIEKTLDRTVLAVFNTSFTTAIAFLATAVSPAMPISSFGIYAALTIITNYLFVLTFTPNVILIKTKYINKWCSCKRKVEDQSSFDDVSNSNNQESENELNLGYSYIFFKKIYYPLLNYKFKGLKIFPIISLLILTSYGIFNLIEASKLSPPVEQEKWFNDKHMYTGFVDSMTNDFKSSNIDEYAEVTIAWGIKGIDRKDYKVWEPNDYRGEVEFYEKFNLINKNSLENINKACDIIDNYQCFEEGCSGEKGKLAMPNTTICFVKDFKNFDSKSLLLNLTYFRSNTIPSKNKFKTWKNYIGLIENEIKFVTISFKSTIKSLTPMRVKKPVYELTEKMIGEINKINDKNLGDSFQDAGITWVWFDIERNLINSMFTGLAICFPISFLVLLFATRNWYLSFVSIISIGFVVGNVLGFCKFYMNWHLGIAETVAAVIVIGFSIDYTVHIGHMYQEADDFDIKNREGRTLYALERMGSTVVAGAITTAGSALFMLGCQMTFFYKMALLISITILYSLIYSLIFLISFMILLGPEDKFGMIKYKK